MSGPPSIRVVVRLPYNRPEQARPDPPRIEWNAEKENILWEVIARSRATDSGGTDWKGLAAHLEVPLPYLLYRAQTRYEQDLRGLQGFTSAGSPTVTQTVTKINTESFPSHLDRDKPSLLRRTSSRLASPRSPRLSSSTRLGTPRARIGSLPARSHKVSTSSTLTLTVREPPRSLHPPLKPLSGPSSGEETDSEDEEAEQEERRERELEEQALLDHKLQELQRMMTSDALGLVHSSRSAKGKEVDRGRVGLQASEAAGRAAGSMSTAPHSPRSQSVSSTSSPQGSIPSIPSPPPESQRSSPISINRRMSPAKTSASPPVFSSNRNSRAMRVGTLTNAARTRTASDHGSSASSFSDIGEGSLSPSALESAYLSNSKSAGMSRFSSFARSTFSGRRGVPH